MTLALAGEVTVPVDVAVGPSALLITGPVARDQPVHSGLYLSIDAVLDQAWLRKNRKHIPSRFRSLAKRMDEVRYSPFIWLPDTLVISPAIGDTGIYGASWRPWSLGIPWIRKPFRFTTSAGVRVTGLFIHSTSLPSPTVFIRPGLDLRAVVEIPLSKRIHVSLAWASHFYPPQRLGGSILDFGPLDESIWHIGQGSVALHVRVPYKTRL